ncbi:MAG: hypothetical protein ACRD0P_13845 [Stackebrandtia sp.]
MHFFADDERRSSAAWPWRNSILVGSLALVSSLAVGIAAAGGLSVLDEPTSGHDAQPPPAEPRPPVPIPTDPPPPNPNPPQPAESDVYVDSAPGERDRYTSDEAEPVSAPGDEEAAGAAAAGAEGPVEAAAEPVTEPVEERTEEPVPPVVTESVTEVSPHLPDWGPVEVTVIWEPLAGEPAVTESWEIPDCSGEESQEPDEPTSDATQDLDGNPDIPWHER